MPRIGTGLGLGLFRAAASGGGGFDPDAQAFFDRVTTAGGTLSTTEKTATNQLVLDMKSAGIWTAMKAIYPMVGASAAACAQNLKSSSFTGTFSSGWTFASTGVTGNGTSTSFNTTLVPLTSLSVSSGHLSIYIRTNIEAQDCDFGSDSASSGGPGGNEQVILSRFTALGFVGVYGVYNGAIANTNSQGMYITNRNSLTNTSQYKNGVNIRDVIQTTGLASNALTIGAESGRTRYTSRQYAFASIGDGLTDTQASNFYTAVQAFQTTLNRYVDAPWYNNGNLLLDTYPSAAAAYSVRKLRNNYIGGPIRVRRSSDNAEQDIYFDSNGNLDTAQLTTFCSGTNGFVTTWYDQSGNGVNLVQTTAITQPKIVTAGVISTTNSKPSIDFSSHFLQSVSNYSVNQLLSTFAILYPTAAGSSVGLDIFGQYFAPTNPYNIWSVETYNTNKFSASWSNGSAWNTPQLNSYTNNVQYQITTIYDSTVITERLDGANQLTTSRSGSFNTTASPYFIGSWPNDTTQNAFIGTIQEVIIYPAIQNSTNIAAIETNELTYF